MAEQKTKPTEQSVESFLNKIDDESVRDDCASLIKLMSEVTGAKPKMWGASIVGFGQYHYKYESGHEGDACLTGFSPRKQNITIYIMPGFTDQVALLNKLGKHKAGKGCLYIKHLADVDINVLRKMIDRSVKHLLSKYSLKTNH